MCNAASAPLECRAMDQWHKRWPGPSTLVSRTFETKRSTPVLMILAKGCRPMVHQSRPVLRSGGARAAHASGGLAAADPQFLLGVVHVFLTVATLIASWRAIPMLERPCSTSARISLPCDDSIGSGPWKLGSLQQLR